MGRPRTVSPARSPAFLVALAGLLAGLLAPSPQARAQAAPRTGRAIVRGTTGVERIRKGVWELGQVTPLPSPP